VEQAETAKQQNDNPNKHQQGNNLRGLANRLNELGVSDKLRWEMARINSKPITKKTHLLNSSILFLCGTFFILVAPTGYAKQKAITDTGEQVILNSDGTWVYTDNSKKAAYNIGTNKKKYIKPKKSLFLLKSVNNKSAFWINTNKWSFKKNKIGEAAEYGFELKGTDLYGMVITEGIAIPLETLANIALVNAQSEDPDAEIVKKEYRNVNGKEVIHMVIEGIIEGIGFSYVGYYYSDDSGATQFLAFTATSVVDKYKSEINDFLNGLVTQ